MSEEAEEAEEAEEGDTSLSIRNKAFQIDLLLI